MTAIVLNTLNAAVSEHDIDFQSITATHAGSAAGLFELGGADDNGVQIAARVMLPKTQLDSQMKKGLGAIYFGIKDAPSGSAGELLVHTETGDEFAYPVAVRASGVSRGVPGKGIQGEYLALGYRNLNGAGFRIDLIEADVNASQTRRL